MPSYIATFHTHLAAMRSLKNVKGHAASAALSPVPRSLSSSCGTCMRYDAEDTLLELMDKDLESIAEALGSELHAKVSVFKTFGTAMLRHKGVEVEFVGARRESYTQDSRKPQVEAGTLEDDQRRRDFTINAMAWSLNAGSFGELVDPFDGMDDLEECVIRTPCDPCLLYTSPSPRD